ncbi:MAG: phosphopantetheine-binding protein [Bacteroidota bacterium]
MDDLILQLKKEIIDVLNLAEVNIEDIDTEAPLFMEGLGLDSIDALELTVLIEKKYSLKINTTEEGRLILYSVKSMAEYIRKNNKG